MPLTVNVPYGYVKDPENPKHWLVDPEAAAVVKRIFSMCMEGRGPSQIAKQLQEDKVLTVSAYKQSHGRAAAAISEDPYAWKDSTVVGILDVGSTQAARSTSRPTPTPSGTRSNG
mgnify:CR=1 FL=1